MKDLTVADRIKMRRLELGLSQDELAKRMGYSTKSAVSRTENSGDKVGTNRIKAFAKALNCPVSYLMGFDDEIEIPDVVQGTAEIIDLYSRATSEQRLAVLNLLRSFVSD